MWAHHQWPVAPTSLEAPLTWGQACSCKIAICPRSLPACLLHYVAIVRPRIPTMHQVMDSFTPPGASMADWCDPSMSSWGHSLPWVIVRGDWRVVWLGAVSDESTHTQSAQEASSPGADHWRGKARLPAGTWDLWKATTTLPRSRTRCSWWMAPLWSVPEVFS